MARRADNSTAPRGVHAGVIAWRTKASFGVCFTVFAALATGCGDLTETMLPQDAPTDFGTTTELSAWQDVPVRMDSLAADARELTPDAPRDASGDAALDAALDAAMDAADVGDVAPAPDVPPAPDVAPAPDVPPAPSGIAPRGAVAGEVLARDGANTFTLTAGAERVFRIDAQASEHLGFRLGFAPQRVALVMALERWNGRASSPLGETDAGLGLRVLAAFDPGGPRTFWLRVRAMAAVTNLSLGLTRTPFREGSRCADDCERLLQLPLPNDPRVDGYAFDGSSVFRYWFGRRDMLMFVRHAGQAMARMGRSPFVPQDLSQWDGMTPGADTGALRHASHQRGKDVDLSLYGTDGTAPWRSYCAARSTSEGRECASGSARGLDAEANVRMFAELFGTGRVTMCFLDRELIAPVQAAARRASLSPEMLARFLDGRHLQHWPNHDNHIHVRISEGPSTGSALLFEAFEPP